MLPLYSHVPLSQNHCNRTVKITVCLWQLEVCFTLPSWLLTVFSSLSQLCLQNGQNLVQHCKALSFKKANI